MLVRIVMAAAIAAGLACAQGGDPMGGGGGMSGGGGGMGRGGGGGMSGEMGGMGGGGGMSGGGGGGMGRGGGGGMSGEMGGMGGGGMRPQRQTKAEIFAEKLKLKNDQKVEVEKILSNAFEKAGTVRGQLGQQRAAIAQAMLGKASEQDLKKAFADYAAIAAQMTGIESDAFAKVYAILKPNQQAKAAQTFELMAGMFLGNAGGGGGGMGRGRGPRGGGE